MKTGNVKHGYVVDGNSINIGLSACFFLITLLAIIIGVQWEKINWLESQALETQGLKEEIYRRRILDAKIEK